MRKNTRRLNALLLAVILFAAAVITVGCKNNQNQNQNTDTTKVTGTEQGDSSGVTTEIPEDELYKDLPTGSYDGYKFQMLQYHDAGAQFTIDMDVEEDDGTLIVSDLYNRTITVEDRLEIDVSLQTVGTTGEVIDLIRNDIRANDGTYDCFSNHSAFIATHIINDELLSYDEFADIDFSKPWWSKSVMDGLTFKESGYYMAFGYINMTLYDSQCVVAFNKDICRDYNYEDLYSVVDANEWTIDKFSTMAKTHAANGEDLYGASMYPYVGAVGLVYGCGVDFFERDGSGNIQYIGMTDKMYEVYGKLAQVLSDNTVTNLDWATYFSCFSGGKSLFFIANISAFKAYRAENFDYGIIPFPKYDENQEKFFSYTTNQAQPVCVSTANTNPDRTGVIIENLCAESYRYLNDDYYDVLINEKLLRDDESKRMLRLILESPFVLPLNGVFEIGASPYLGSVIDFMQTTDINTRLAAIESGILTSMETLKAKFK